MKSARKPAKRDAHSLLEILITVALIMVMYVMMFGPSTKFHQTQQMTKCARNLQHLHVALNIYAGDHDGMFPASLTELVPRYTADTAIFICPGKRNSGYAYYRGRSAKDGADAALMSDAQVNDRPKLQHELVFSDDGKAPGNNHRKFGGNILFCDGHMTTSEPHSGQILPFSEPVTLVNPAR